MADSGNEIVTEIRLELDKFRADLKEAQVAGEAAAGKAAKEMGNAVEEGVGKVAGKLKTEFLALGGAIVAAFATDKIIAAASEQQDAINSLNAAMLSAGTYTDAASDSFQKYAQHLQTVSKVADEVIEKNAAMLISTSRLKGEGLEKATQAALDFSAAMNIDVDRAFNIVGKAAEGNLGQLSRYGIFLHSTGDEAADFGRVLDQLNARFGGAAAAQMQTFSGSLARLKNTFNDVQETMGDLIIRSPLVVGVMNTLTKVFETFNEKLAGAGGGKDVIGLWTRSLINFGQSIVQYVLPPLELLYNLGKIAFDALATGLQALIFASSKAILVLLEVASTFTHKFDEMRDNMRAVVEDTGNVLTGLAAKTSESMDQIFDFGFTQKTEEFLGKTATFVAKFGDEMLKMPKKIQAPIDIITKQMEQLRAALQQVVLGSMVNIVSGGIQRLGAALVQGHSAFADFKNFALNALGDMSIKMGEAMITQSAAFVALAALISNPFTAPAAAIAFGIALIALGGVLKAAAASGAGGASAAGTSPSGGGVIASGGYGTPPVADQGQAPTQARGEVGSHVQVIVQGNVLDRRQTGLELADAINEAFGSNGVKFATG